MNAKRSSLFCPYCNARGSAQPVLSPMVCKKVRVAPLESATAPEPTPTPYLHYRCERCGYSEIHDQTAADAA